MFVLLGITIRTEYCVCRPEGVQAICVRNLRVRAHLGLHTNSDRERTLYYLNVKGMTIRVRLY